MSNTKVNPRPIFQGDGYMVFGREYSSPLKAQEAVRKRYEGQTVTFISVAMFDCAYSCYINYNTENEKEVYEIKYAR